MGGVRHVLCCACRCLVVHHRAGRRTVLKPYLAAGIDGPKSSVLTAGVSAPSSCWLLLTFLTLLSCCLAEICDIWSDLNVDFLSFGAVLFVIAQTMFLGTFGDSIAYDITVRPASRGCDGIMLCAVVGAQVPTASRPACHMPQLAGP